MELDLFKSFVAVAEARSFSRAEYIASPATAVHAGSSISPGQSRIPTGRPMRAWHWP